MHISKEFRRKNFNYKIGCTILLNKIKITTYFEILTVEWHIFCSLNTHVKFCFNKILFII